MSIDFLCCECESELSVPKTDVGKKARCPRCGTIQSIPSPSTSDGMSGGSDESADGWMMKNGVGEVFGPVTSDQLDQWASAGRIASNYRLMSPGEAKWLPATDRYPQLKELFEIKDEPLVRPIQQVSPVSTRRESRTSLDPVRTPFPDQLPLPANNGCLILLVSVFASFLICFPPAPLILLWVNYSSIQEIKRKNIRPDGRMLFIVGFFVCAIGFVLSSVFTFSMWR